MVLECTAEGGSQILDSSAPMICYVSMRVRLQYRSVDRISFGDEEAYEELIEDLKVLMIFVEGDCQYFPTARMIVHPILCAARRFTSLFSV